MTLVDRPCAMGDSLSQVASYLPHIYLLPHLIFHATAMSAGDRASRRRRCERFGDAIACGGEDEEAWEEEEEGDAWIQEEDAEWEQRRRRRVMGGLAEFWSPSWRKVCFPPILPTCLVALPSYPHDL